MRQIFIDNKINDAFTQDGFVVIPGLLKTGECHHLEKLFFSLLEEAQLDIPFFTTHWSSNSHYRRKVHEEVSSYLYPLLAGYFRNYKNIYGYYLTKMPGGNNRTVVHQDWAMVDESNYAGVTFWCPLVDVDMQNGCFRVIPGSHTYFNNYRGTNIKLPYADWGNQLEEQCLVSLELKAGDAVFFDHRLVHASPPNLSKKTRVAVGMVLIPDEAAVIHYLQKDGSILKYKANDDFLQSFYYNYKEPSTGLFDTERLELAEIVTPIMESPVSKELTLQKFSGQ